MSRFDITQAKPFVEDHKGLAAILNPFSKVGNKAKSLMEMKQVKFNGKFSHLSGMKEVRIGDAIFNQPNKEGCIVVNRIYNLDIDGYRIPSLEKAFILVHKCAGELSEIREIEWSVCLNENGEAYLVDANVSEDLIFEQTPEYLNNRVGLRYYYKNYLSRIKRW